MKFDKSKVYTPFNCDELKVGSKGYFADYRAGLIERVTKQETDKYHTLVSIDENESHPFKTENITSWQFFYLVEEPKEKTKRPCTREELIEMLKKQELPMLYRNQCSVVYTILLIKDEDIVLLSALDDSLIHYDYSELCSDFTLLDGTNLWVEE